MTDDDRKPGAGWELVEDLLAEEEIERQRALPAEERRAALKAQGLDPDRAHTVANEVLVKLGLPGVAATAPPAPTAAPAEAPKVVSLAAERGKRRPSPRWTIALVAAAAAVVLAGGGGAIVALNTPAPSATTPAPPIPTAPPGPSPEELAQQQRAKAEELRKVAAAQCGAEKWGACGKSLAEAATLDPRGEESRQVRRLQGKAERGLIEENLETKVGAGARSLRPAERPTLVAALAASKGQALRVVCPRAGEPSRLCDQLVAAFTSAGWTVTRTTMPAVAPDAAAFHGMLVEVATDADDATQAAADVLARGLEGAFLLARGPDDMAPGGDAPLRLTIGPQ